MEYRHLFPPNEDPISKLFARCVPRLICLAATQERFNGFPELSPIETDGLRTSLTVIFSAAREVLTRDHQADISQGASKAIAAPRRALMKLMKMMLEDFEGMRRGESWLAGNVDMAPIRLLTLSMLNPHPPFIVDLKTSNDVVCSFLTQLLGDWKKEVVFRNGSSLSVMPWSIPSRQEIARQSLPGDWRTSIRHGSEISVDLHPVWQEGSFRYNLPTRPNADDHKQDQSLLPSYLDGNTLEQDPITRIRALPVGRFVYMLPIPWPAGTHDGYPVSSTLGEYTAIRHKADASRLEDADLWQNAMTFGVLEAITGIAIPESLLVSPDVNGERTFVDDMLSPLIYDWTSRLAVTHIRDPSFCKTWADHTVRILHRAFQDLGEVVTAPICVLVRAGMSPPDFRRVICHVHTLLTSLANSATLLGMQNGIFDWQLTRSFMHNSSANHITNRVYAEKLVATGWCPFAVHRLITHDPPALAYVTVNCKPPIREHEDEHKRCTPSECSYQNIDTTSYVNRHIFPDCTCEYLTPPIASVMSLLESEQIPVLMFDGTSLRVRPASEGPYLAISHVWADGLGSVTERGLPVCQVRRIAAYASRLVPSGAFWMDSLCVPERKDLRKQAIVLMARTYEGSQSVLVLDSMISACPVSLPQKERMVRLQTSGWMQRIWTLQEAMLARQLVFLVSDELIEAQAFLHPPPTPTALSSGARSCYVPIDAPDGLLWGGSGHFLMFPAELRTSRNFPLVLHFLENRVTSKPEDETLALSGLLKLDTAKLLSVSTAEERMRIFLLLVRVLPTNIIFYLGPRLPMPGFRWAPRTLTSASGGVDAMNAFCTEEGLEGDYTVVHFSGEDLNIERTPVGDVMWFVHREKPDERGHLYTAGIITDTWHPNDPTPAVRINAIVLQTSHLLRETGKRFIAAGVFAPPLQQDGWEERMASGTRLACEYVAPLGMWKQNDGHPHKGPCCTLIETPILLT